MARRGFGHSGVSADINVTPMADIMLVLLIIFMLTVPSMQNGITVNLPKAINPLDAPGVNKPENFVVALNREGMIYVGKKQVEEKTRTKAENIPRKGFFTFALVFTSTFALVFT